MFYFYQNFTFFKKFFTSLCQKLKAAVDNIRISTYSQYFSTYTQYFSSYSHSFQLFPLKLITFFSNLFLSSSIYIIPFKLIIKFLINNLFWFNFIFPDMIIIFYSLIYFNISFLYTIYFKMIFKKYLHSFLFLIYFNIMFIFFFIKIF